MNYTENILRNVLTSGLADSEIQLDLLGNKHQDMTLKEVFQRSQQTIRRAPLTHPGG